MSDAGTATARRGWHDWPSIPVLIGALAVAASACGAGRDADDGSEGRPAVDADAPEAPAQLSLFSYFNNGTVAPPGAYSVTIRVSSDGRGRLDYERGYGEVRDSLVFRVDPDSVRRFYATLRPRLVSVDESIDEGEPPEEIGGPVSSFSVTADSVEYRLGGGDVASLEGFLPQPLPEIRRRMDAGAP